MALTERKLTVGDGTVLHVEHHLPPGAPVGSLVMIHGFAVHCGRYRQIASALAAAGLAVTAFDCRGHGQSTGRRGFVRRFPEFLDDVQAVVEWARQAPGPEGKPVADNLPVALLGHSHGGLLALRYALTDRSQVAALVLAAPWLELKLKVPRWKLAISEAVGRVWPGLSVGNELRSDDTTRDPAMRTLWANDPLAHHVATARWFNEVRAAQSYILDHATSLTVPTLLAVAGDDRIVSTEAALRFAGEAGGMVEVKVYENAFHELFLEPEWKTIVEDCASWVVARLSAPYTSVIG